MPRTRRPPAQIGTRRRENSNLTEEHNALVRAGGDVRGREPTVPVKRGTLWCTMAAMAIRVGNRQPWHKSDSRFEGIRSYRWKSRCRQLPSRLHAPQ